MKSGLLILQSTSLAAAETKHPNIIFIMSDDQGYGDAGCYNPSSNSTCGADRTPATHRRSPLSGISPTRQRSPA